MRSLILLLFIFSSGCLRQSHRTGFFPSGSFYDCTSKGVAAEERKNKSQKEEQVLERLFRSVDEPSLYERSNDKHTESYRFTWFRAFDRTIIVRIIVEKYGQGTIMIKGFGGVNEETRGLTEVRPLEINSAEVESFKRLLDGSLFWTIAPCENLEGVDGSTWILEGACDGKYRVVVRRGAETVEFRAAIQNLIALADLKNEPFY